MAFNAVLTHHVVTAAGTLWNREPPTTGLSASIVLVLVTSPVIADHAGCLGHSRGFRPPLTFTIGRTNSPRYSTPVCPRQLPQQALRPLPVPTLPPTSFAAASPPFTADFSRTQLSGKLANAACGDDAACPTWPENHLFTNTTRRNKLDADVDGFRVSALINAGANISVLSSNLRRRLPKVLTPDSSPTP